MTVYKNKCMNITMLYRGINIIFKKCVLNLIIALPILEPQHSVEQVSSTIFKSYIC